MTPFEDPHALAKVIPIFTYTGPSARGGNTRYLPEILTTSADCPLKGHSMDERITYGAGEVVTTKEMNKPVARIFENPEMIFIHPRYARNSCYQARL